MKLFRKGTLSPHVSEVVTETKVTLPPLNTDEPPESGREYAVPTSYAGFSATARFSVLRWPGPAQPTLVYHHGSGESNYTARVRRIAKRMDTTIQGGAAVPHKGGSLAEEAVAVPADPANIIACSVPYNHTLKEYLHGAARLDRWVFLLAASVRLTEALTTSLIESGCMHVVCAGISLGGWITNLHHTYFDTCDIYAPIFAGAALDDLFTDSIYRKLLASSAREAGDRFRSTLNFEEEFAARGNANVYPVMARYDQFIRFERQSEIYRPEQMTVLERGHTTGAVAYRQLGRHLASHVSSESTCTKGDT